MELNDAIGILSALAQATRYRCVSHLMEHGESTAGDLAAILGVPPNTMSSHLTILSHAGLVTFTRSGRHILYSPCRERVLDVLRKLSELVDRKPLRSSG